MVNRQAIISLVKESVYATNGLQNTTTCVYSYLKRCYNLSTGFIIVKFLYGIPNVSIILTLGNQLTPDFK